MCVWATACGTEGYGIKDFINTHWRIWVDENLRTRHTYEIELIIFYGAVGALLLGSFATPTEWFSWKFETKADVFS